MASLCHCPTIHIVSTPHSLLSIADRRQVTWYRMARTPPGRCRQFKASMGNLLLTTSNHSSGTPYMRILMCNGTRYSARLQGSSLSPILASSKTERWACTLALIPRSLSTTERQELSTTQRASRATSQASIAGKLSTPGFVQCLQRRPLLQLARRSPRRLVQVRRILGQTILVPCIWILQARSRAIS